MQKNISVLVIIAAIVIMSIHNAYGITGGYATYRHAVGTVGPATKSLGLSWNASGGTCSGTLIGPRVVLTAAHCFCEADDNRDGYADCEKYSVFHFYEMVEQRSDERSDIIYGEVLLRRIGSIWGTVIIHPEYTNNFYDSAGKSHDIALLILDNSPDGIIPWPISRNRTLPMKGEKLTLYGYGYTGVGCEDRRRGLRETWLPITDVIPYDGGVIDLVDKIENVEKTVKNCAAGCIKTPNNTYQPFPERRGMCKGDSGGPAIDSHGDIVAVMTISGPEQSPPIDPLRQCIIKPTGFFRKKPPLGRAHFSP